ncbi:MAG TPA: hypothetical protein VGK51_03540 [Actinomycetota bacterium]
MTSGPAGGPGGPEIPRLLSAQFRAASITEFAYLTPRGEPLCWPVTPYWYPDRGVLGISTGLGYPNKAYYARRHPRVAALFGSTLLQGDAVVLDDDLQANTDRYIREMRQKFLSARLGLNPISVKLLDFYLPRVWIEISPVRLVVGGRGFGGSLLQDLRPATKDDRTPPAPPALAPGPQLDALLRWVRRASSAVVALGGPDGYPAIARVGVAEGPDGTVELEAAPGTGPAALTFHTQGLGGVRLDAVMARGRVEASDGPLRFVPRRVVGFLGREPERRPSFLSIFPLSQFPRAGAFRETLRDELARRGEALPKLRVPH